MKLSITGIQLAGILSAAIASGAYSPAGKGTLGRPAFGQTCMCWGLCTLEDQGKLPRKSAQDAAFTIEKAMNSNGRSFAFLKSGLVTDIDEDYLTSPDAAPALLRWYAALILWGIQYGDKLIDTDEVPGIAFNDNGSVKIHDD